MVPAPVLASSAAIEHTVYEGQQSVRLKTNEEWAAEASAKADAAAAAVLRQVTIERVNVLHSNILNSLYGGGPANADVLNEYVTLVSE
jgi:GTP cyclohydrolase II